MSAAANESLSDEDKLIAAMIVDGSRSLYNDTDFLPIRQSLYNAENVIPMYDDEKIIQWCRPHAFSVNPEWFNSTTISVQQGTLPDETFIGALVAVATFPKRDMIEAIVASKPEDFKKFGLFTCRFYVEGDWVEVLTDTNVPCFRNDVTNEVTPAYSHSTDPDELWITLVEKAYAKAVGSFEAIQKVKVHEALMHLSGGSVQQINLFHEESGLQLEVPEFWHILNGHLQEETIIVAIPAVKRREGAENPETAEGLDAQQQATTTEVDKNYAHFHPNRLYSVILTRETADFELILMHNPWGLSQSEDGPVECWTGEWGNGSGEWDLYPEFLSAVEADPAVPWSRRNPNGYFWISHKNFKKHFNHVYFSKMFPNERFKFYCVKGQWLGKEAGGPMTTIRDKTIVAKDAFASKVEAKHKSSIATVVDSDASWFNNPKVRFHCARFTSVCISLVPLTGDKDGGGHVASFHVVAVPKSSIVGANQMWIWDATACEVVGTEKPDGSGKVKGQEVSLWDLKLSPKNYYYLIPNTLKRGQEGTFFFRLFASEPLAVEKVPPVFSGCITGEWTRHGDLDTTGGSLRITNSEGVTKENPKWCQNPQFYIELQNSTAMDDVHMKVVVRRTDKTIHGKSSAAAIGGGGDAGAKAIADSVGLVVCKAEFEEEGNVKSARKKGIRQNAMGDVIPSKVSTLKKKPIATIEDRESYQAKAKEKSALRKLSLAEDGHVFETTYSSRQEGCIYFPILPRSWTTTGPSGTSSGLMIIPSLGEKGVKGSFELEVYASEPFKMKQLPDTYSRSIAAEWTEQTAVGSHLYPSWKKNPKFSFKFRTGTQYEPGTPVPVKITLGRHGIQWKSQIKRDPINAMIGFYVFAQPSDGGELIQLYESPFVPAEEASTDSDFTLDFLLTPSSGRGFQGGTQEYIIMPATFGEGKLGAFILTVMTNCEFHLAKEK